MMNHFNEVIELLVKRLGLDRRDITVDEESQTITWSVGDPDDDLDNIASKYDTLDMLEPALNDMGFSLMTQDDAEYFGAVLTFDEPEEDTREVTFPTAFGAVIPYDPTPLSQEGQQTWHNYIGVNDGNVYIGGGCTGSKEPGYLGCLAMKGKLMEMEDVVKWEAKFFGTEVPPTGMVQDPDVAAKILRNFGRAQRSQQQSKPKSKPTPRRKPPSA